jgi:hypothetical protein
MSQAPSQPRLSESTSPMISGDAWRGAPRNLAPGKLAHASRKMYPRGRGEDFCGGGHAIENLSDLREVS